MTMNCLEIEKKILKFWQEKKIFEKLQKKNQGRESWSFLDGPITANNPMGVHHAWGRTYKDLFQRYKAMNGFAQRFQNGFDCQGLWVEVEVEKELGFKTKKDIEKFGIEKFVEACKKRVLKYSKIQTEQSIRLGQWMDWKNSYYTMSDKNNYAIWGFLKKCYEQGYLYKGRDSVPWCPRCSTAISQHEILTEEYKEITHTAVYFKLPIQDSKYKNTSFLIWTTTPWTIPANVALAVNPNFQYGLYKNDKEGLILLKDLASAILDKSFKLEKEIAGSGLIGLQYVGPFDNLERIKKAKAEHPKTFHTVVGAEDLVTAKEGTGIIHIAPGAGAEDFQLGKEENLAVIDVIDEEAFYLEEMGEFTGQSAKTKPEIIFDYLKNQEKGRFFYKTENYTHRYPTCWRCKTELVWRVVDEWYISMEKIRKSLMEVAKKIKWIPSFGLERELDWLKNMQDWLISKKRYWGLALPIYECKNCGNFEVIGSKEELKQKAVKGWEEFEGYSPHRPWVDKVKIKCSKCGELISRIPDVGNPWLDAGIVPFSTMGYFTDKDYWQEWFPADFICESFPGQFKNWFYSLIVMSTVLESVAPVKTIFGYASVRDEKGEEMHKSKGNVIWFDEAVEKIGADVMRWMYIKQNPVYNLRFGYKASEEIKRKLLTLWNSYVFLKTYVAESEFPAREPKVMSKNILDNWLFSRLNNLIEKVTKSLDRYNAAAASGAIAKFFIEDLSLWYIRRSRKRFQRPEGKKEKREATETLYFTILNLIKLIAPMMPFLSEEIYLNLKTKKMPESIHLCDWPRPDKEKINPKLEKKMERIREIVTLALAERAAAAIRVRQPLLKLEVQGKKLEKELTDLIKEEVNIKNIVFNEKLRPQVRLDVKILPRLKTEGIVREVIRQIQETRKKGRLLPKDKVTSYVVCSKKLEQIITRNKNLILKTARLKTLELGGKPKKIFDVEKETEIDGQKLWLAIKKV